MVARSKFAAIRVIIAGMLILGFLISDDYGQSWDDSGDARYGSAALQAYTGSSGAAGIGRYHGPFYFMLSAALNKPLLLLRPSWLQTSSTHFTNFLSFQLGVFAVFMLSLRFVSVGAAVIATLLFASQPLLFGHAFINQKDIPFMSFFLITMVLGLSAVDRWRDRQRNSTDPSSSTWKGAMEPFKASLLNDWQLARRRAKAGFVLSLAFGILISAVLLLELAILPMLRTLVHVAYQGEAWTPIQRAFDYIAQDAYKTPAPDYVMKVGVVYSWLKIPLLLAAFMPAVLAGKRVFKGVILRLGPEWRTQSFYLVIAATCLGLTSSIRLAGVFAGVLVSVLYLMRIGWRAWRPLVIYWGLAALVIYLTSPLLWTSPLTQLWEEVNLMLSFPSHQVLFQGEYLSSHHLPWHYFPTLLAIQLTEPLIVLIIIGVALSVWKIRNRDRQWPELAVLAAWIGLPLAASVFFRTPIYGNMRQLLFSISPLFIFAAVGLAATVEKVRPAGLKVIILGAVLLPGIIGIVRLRPYEYVYYNALVGGVDGAAGEYALDYWCTSYREAMEFVNATASPNASIVVWRPVSPARTFARDDLAVVSDLETDVNPQFAIACKRAITSPNVFRDMQLVMQVNRGDAVYAVVRKSQ